MILHHGTTRQRAESILQNGPSARFAEPGGRMPPFGFYMLDAELPSSIGTAEWYARGKATHFPNEGGPVILEVEIPDDIARLGLDPVGEYCFDQEFGLEELLTEWPRLDKRILAV